MEWSCRETFLDLLYAGLGLAELPQVSLDAEQWEQVHAMAVRQAVVALVFDAVARLTPECRLPKVQAARWAVEAQRNELSYARMSQVIAAQEAAWKRHGITAHLQKGHTVAAMYPQPEHRATGDIDWYLPTRKDWDAANELARRNGLEVKLDSDGDSSYELAGIAVEHHRHGWQMDDPVQMIAMLVDHVLHHAMVMGIGMKQVCDVAVAYRALEGKYSPEDLESMLRRHGLLKFDALLRRVNARSDDPDAQAFLDLVFADGHFGLDKRNRFAGAGKRARLFLKYAPGAFFRRWVQLIFGRIRRCFIK